MGNTQSNVSHSSAPKESLYDLLGVSRSASEDELKKAYRRTALLLHPDRNYNKEEEATMKFAKVQAAYDILSDPQERAWYDNHQNTGEYSEYNPAVTSADEIKSYMSATVLRTMKTNSDEFFHKVSDLFERLRNEELEAAFDQKIEKADVLVANVPLFGTSTTSWESVKTFYNAWGTFNTLKTYSWEEVYPTHNAEDRRTRRAMEGRNKRIRDAARREFNEAVRSLVKIVKDGDPRVRKQQKLQRDQQERSRTKPRNQAKKADTRVYEEQEWTKVSYSDDDDQPIEDDTLQLYECVVCDKIFKNKQQLINHEMSSKHVKAVRKLQWEMKQEGIEFGLEGDEPRGLSKGDNSSRTSVPAGPASSLDVDDDDGDNVVSDDHDSDSSVDGGRKHRMSETLSHPEQGLSTVDGDLEARIAGLSVEDILSQMDQHRKGRVRGDSDTVTPGRLKAGRAKQKRMQRSKNTTDFALKCTTCQSEFSTRNKLFDHIKTSRHAAPIGMDK